MLAPNPAKIAYVPSLHFVATINEQLIAYPESITIKDAQGFLRVVPFPYLNGLDSLISICVKTAASPTGDIQQSYIRQMMYDLSAFPVAANQELANRMQNFITYLITIFTRYGWYDEYGTCAWRFTGFAEPSFDLVLRRT